MYRSKLCIPHLSKSANPHILNISPPLNMKPGWFSNHCGELLLTKSLIQYIDLTRLSLSLSVAYTIAKYGMSMCVLGMAEELKPAGIAVNALWPRTGKQRNKHSHNNCEHKRKIFCLSLIIIFSVASIKTEQFSSRA